MTETWRFIDLRGLDPYVFQCLREVLTESPRTMLFTQLLGEHVSIGKNANLTKMVRQDFCKENGIPIIRSMSPVKTQVFVDENTIRCLVVANENIPFYEAAVASLKYFGLDARHIQDTNNIVIKEQKVSVCNIHSHRNSILFPWSIALDFNYDRAEKAIISPKDMRGWVTTVKKELGREVSVDELKGAVKHGFQQTLGIVFEEGELFAEELNGVKELLPKYKSESWLRTGRWSPVKDYGR